MWVKRKGIGINGMRAGCAFMPKSFGGGPGTSPNFAVKDDAAISEALLVRGTTLFGFQFKSVVWVILLILERVPPACRHAALSSLILLFIMEQKLLLKPPIREITAYNIQELINATIATLSSMDQIIQKITRQIRRYQHQIENQQKRVT